MKNILSISMLIFVQNIVFCQNSNPKIANGEFIEITDVPWQISIENVDMGEIGCSGSIISEEWILTAAHCFGNNSDAYDYRIHAGSSSLSDLNDGQVV